MKTKVVVALLLWIFMTTGCIRKTELDELAFFSGVGIDQLETGKIQLTLQVILHRELKVQAQSGNLPSNNIILEGDSIPDANSNFSLQSGRRGIWSHARAIIIGEGLAKSGIGDILDYMQRDYEILGRTYLVVSKGDARTILDAETTNLETIQSFNISDMVEQYKSNGKTFPINLNDYLLRAAQDTGINFLPGIKQLEGKSKIQSGKDMNALQMSEIAILKDNKLIGWFDESETTGLLFIHNKLSSTVLNFEYPDNTEKAYVTIQHSKCKMTPQYENGQLKKVTITVKAAGILTQGNRLIDPSKPSVLEEVGEKAAAAIEEKIHKAIEKGQLLNADVFDISTKVHRTNPKLWADIKPSWSEVFGALDFDIKAEVTIQRSGLVTKSIQ
ncbi:MAG: Ger(x)C family spore germination protein [Vallitaleaceae bacterium]|nr:Ger(x)C family spore germination protein [Vallitaleaceae bacterium]